MAVRRRLPTFSSASEPINSDLKDSDAIPLPLYLTNDLFFTVAYFLFHWWCEKIRSHTPFHVLTFSEIAAFFALVALVIYLLGFFGIEFVQSFVTFIIDGSSRHGRL